MTNSQVHRYDTRTAGNYRVHSCRTNIKKFTILYQRPGLWNLNSTSNSPVALRRLSCQISTNQREAEARTNVNKHWKTKGNNVKGNDVITNAISANQHFAWTFSMSMQIFKFQRCICKLSFLFPPCRQRAPESLLAGYKLSGPGALSGQFLITFTVIVMEGIIWRLVWSANRFLTAALAKCLSFTWLDSEQTLLTCVFNNSALSFASERTEFPHFSVGTPQHS